jgi:thioredoxin-like negative regulator of GroEL
MKSAQDGPISLNEDNFEKEVLASKRPVLVLVKSHGYGSSEIMLERFEKLADSCGESVRLGTLDAGQNRELAESYQAETIPTTLIFKGGVLIDRMPFLVSVDDLRARINGLL